MMALQSSVTRTDIKGNVWGTNQKVTFEEAIKIGTIKWSLFFFTLAGVSLSPTVDV